MLHRLFTFDFLLKTKAKKKILKEINKTNSNKHYTHGNNRKGGGPETMEARRQWNDIFNLRFMKNSVCQCDKQKFHTGDPKATS